MKGREGVALAAASCQWNKTQEDTNPLLVFQRGLSYPHVSNKGRESLKKKKRWMHPVRYLGLKMVKSSSKHTVCLTSVGNIEIQLKKKSTHHLTFDTSRPSPGVYPAFQKLLPYNHSEKLSVFNPLPQYTLRCLENKEPSYTLIYSCNTKLTILAISQKFPVRRPRRWRKASQWLVVGF